MKDGFQKKLAANTKGKTGGGQVDAMVGAPEVAA